MFKRDRAMRNKLFLSPIYQVISISLVTMLATFLASPGAISQSASQSSANQATERPCPGNCLKANDPRWQHMKVAGHPDSDLWIKFPYPGGSRSWNQNHIGEVIEYVNGVPENKGRCPICGGTTRVANR